MQNPFLKSPVAETRLNSKICRSLGLAEISSDWKSVIERDDIDIVDIATPTHLHHEMVIHAAKHGKHIFCEKPLALNLAEAESMLEAVNSAIL